MEEISIDIEVCYNCNKHNWFTRHNEKKYDQYFKLSIFSFYFESY